MTWMKPLAGQHVLFSRSQNVPSWNVNFHHHQHENPPPNKVFSHSSQLDNLFCKKHVNITGSVHKPTLLTRCSSHNFTWTYFSNAYRTTWTANLNLSEIIALTTLRVTFYCHFAFRINILLGSVSDNYLLRLHVFKPLPVCPFSSQTPEECANSADRFFGSATTAAVRSLTTGS